MSKILLVTVDIEVKRLLDRQPFAVEFEPEGANAVQRAMAGNFDLVILDSAMPQGSCAETLRLLRNQSEVPILILSANEDRCEKIKALQLGADDYLTKPFDSEELLARIASLLRRVARFSQSASECLQIGALRLLPGAREAWLCDRKLELTAMECDVLELLMRSCGRPVSRDELTLRLYNRPASAFDRAVDTHVSRIRRKLGEARNSIISVRGTGYQLKYQPEQI